jgi:redox-sensitive bicupin YhaK (pirin superfamily)
VAKGSEDGMEKLEPRIVHLSPRSGVDIRRTLPHRRIRTIGAWCFLDHYGPTPQVDAMSIAAHPHTGLQTVSWLFSGEIEHCDSLGSRQRIRPGELNIMTSGHGIAHSERSIAESGELHGVQLWVVLPRQDANMAPMFHHHADLPRFDIDGASATLFCGNFGNHNAGVTTFSPLVGLELHLAAHKTYTLPVDSTFEYGVHVAAGRVQVQREEVETGELLYLPPGLTHITLHAEVDSTIVLLGGEPFGEDIIMWWNFIGRSQEEIEDMREQWNAATDRFPAFADDIGGRITAPELPRVQLLPRGNAR